MTSQAPPKPPEKITKERALEIAREAVDEFGGDDDFVIQEDKTVEKEFGWVFFCAPRKYVETGDPKYLIPGAGPFVVERLGGASQFLTTSVHPDKAIEEYEKQWRERGKAKPKP
jgi:immunity protein 35 of polymorphic toxin system